MMPLKKIRLPQRLYYVTRPRFNDYYLNIVQTFFTAREQRARYVARQPFVQRLNNKLKLGKNVLYRVCKSIFFLSCIILTGQDGEKYYIAIFIFVIFLLSFIIFKKKCLF